MRIPRSSVHGDAYIAARSIGCPRHGNFPTVSQLTQKAEKNNGANECSPESLTPIAAESPPACDRS